MKRLLLVLLLASPSWADSTLVLEPIPSPGPQTGERFEQNFQAIKAWTNLIDSDGNDTADSVDTPIDWSSIPPDVVIPYDPAKLSHWTAPVPTTIEQALNDLADYKAAIANLGTITETDYDPTGIDDCVGPQCLIIWVEEGPPIVKHLCYSEVEGFDGWICITPTAGGEIASLAGLKICLEDSTRPGRVCKLAPGFYDGTLFADIPDTAGGEKQHVILEAYGANIAPTGAAVTNNSHLSVVQIETTDMAHDFTLEIRGLKIEGSTDTTEELLTIFQGSGAAPGRIHLADLEIGEDAGSRDGTEQAIVVDTEPGAGYNGSITNVAARSGGMILSWEHIENHLSLNNVKLQGLPGTTSHTRASNLCASIGDSFNASASHMLRMDSLHLKMCGGLTLAAKSISADITMESIGSPTEDEAVIRLENFRNADFDIVLGADGTDAKWSDGNFIELGDVTEGGSVSLNIQDQDCAVFNTTNTMTLFNIDSGFGEYSDWDVRAQLISSRNGFPTCAVVPFGADWLAGLSATEPSRGSAFVDAFGEIYEYYKSPYVARRRFDSQPFLARFGTGTAASSVVWALGAEPLGTGGTGNPTGVGCLASGTGGATQACSIGNWAAYTIIPDRTRPLYINSMNCMVFDGSVAEADEAGDRLDYILQQGDGDYTTGWANTTATVGNVGRVGIPGEELAALGYYESHTAQASPLVFASGSTPLLLRVIPVMGVDTGDPVTTGLKVSKANCTLRGWN